MRKLVFGIIAVVCVQFAFVNYMELQSPLDLAMGPGPVAPPTATDGDLGWIDELDRSAMVLPEPEAPTAESGPGRTPISRKDEYASVDRPTRFEAARPRQAPDSTGPAADFPPAAEDLTTAASAATPHRTTARNSAARRRH